MSIVDSILNVFGDLGVWIVSQLNALTAIFWDPETGLTFLGVLAVCGLGFSVVFLIIGIIQKFLHFRG